MSDTLLAILWESLILEDSDSVGRESEGLGQRSNTEWD